MCGQAGIILGQKRRCAILYASDSAYLDGERVWCELGIPPMSLTVFPAPDADGLLD